MKKDKHVSAMVERLHELHAVDRGERIRNSVTRWIEDPVKPMTRQGEFRVNPILMLLAATVSLAAGTCLFFTLVQL